VWGHVTDVVAAPLSPRGLCGRGHPRFHSAASQPIYLLQSKRASDPLPGRYFFSRAGLHTRTSDQGGRVTRELDILRSFDEHVNHLSQERHVPSCGSDAFFLRRERPIARRCLDSLSPHSHSGAGSTLSLECSAGQGSGQVHQKIHSLRIASSDYVLSRCLC
jgi:hypothetical protein